MSTSPASSPLDHLAPLRAEVSLGALRHNAREILRLARGAHVMGAVKANAYGHGAAVVAHALIGAGIHRLSVANVVEGVRLREAGIEAPILVMGAALPEALPLYAAHELDLAVTSRDGAEAVLASGLPLTIHVKVDTGMHRLGLDPEQVPDALRRLGATENLNVVGLWTHFANVAGGFTAHQVSVFDALVARLGADGVPVPPLFHLANTGGLLTHAPSVDGRHIVRAGGALYGLVSDRMLAGVADLKPVMRLVGRVVQIKTVEAGETVSYGRTWRAEARTSIAVVGAGYGDGVPRALSNRGHAGIAEALYPIAGRVCMDMLMLDLGAPGEAPVEVGDDVVLFGPGGPSTLDVATAAETIAYDLTCRLTGRVPRVTVE